MLTIYKYQLSSNDVTEIVMPQHARILTVQMQNGIPCLWAVVDNERAMTTRRFHVFGTGHPIDKDYTRYIGTFQMYNESLVYHVFEDWQE